MLKKLQHKKEAENEKFQHIIQLETIARNEQVSNFIKKSVSLYGNYTIEFYEVIGDILEYLGFQKVSVTREGDTNNRMDAIIIDDSRSIPIEIKSPMEIEYINVQSIRQALENKIVLLSRGFYPTKEDVTSLAIGFQYPNERSGVYELIDDINKTYGFIIGIIDFSDLLKMFYSKCIDGISPDLEKIYYLNGRLNA
jgi:hypothetical protein